jgi:hypothetical protein
MSIATGEATSMKSPRALVCLLLARVLGTTSIHVTDDSVLMDLELDARHLVLIAIKLEEIRPDRGPFPLLALAHATTVGDFVELVETWWQGGAIRNGATPRTSLM